MSFSYLATPYSKYHGGLREAFIQAARLTARLIVAGHKVYSPIVHTHPIAEYGAFDFTHAFWLSFDETMMKAADSLFVAHMTGWEESKGIAHEIAFFEKAKKPIFDLDVATLALVRR